MLRRALLLPLLAVPAACAASPAPLPGRAAVAEVSLPPAAPAEPVQDDGADEAEPQRSRCVVRGTGERIVADRGTRPFEVFASSSAAAPVVVVHQPWAVHVTWSELPVAGRSRRARVGLGGQKLLRLDGFASLAGRTFQIRRRADVHAGHVWIRGGSAVEILGVEGGRVRVRAETGFAAPAQLDALAACGDLVYEPAELPRSDEDERPAGEIAVATGPNIDLHAAPGGPRLLTVTPGEQHEGPMLSWLEERSGFVRVSGGEGDVILDGWVPASQVEQPYALGLGSVSSSTRCGGLRMRKPLVTVERDAEAWAGAGADGAAIGVVEAGARLELGEERGEHVAFEFEDKEIGAPEGKRLWIRKAAVGR